MIILVYRLPLQPVMLGLSLGLTLNLGLDLDLDLVPCGLVNFTAVMW